MCQTGPGSETGFLPDRGPVSNPDRAEAQTGTTRQTLERNEPDRFRTEKVGSEIEGVTSRPRPEIVNSQEF